MIVVQIDKYFFMVKNNIEGLQKKLSVNLNKQDTLTKPVYTHIGGYSQEVSFSAKILLPDIKFFIGFETMVKEAKPVRINSFDMLFFKRIFITNYEVEVGNFVKSHLFSTLYYTKDIKISGVIMDDEEKNDFGLLGLIW